jgi:anti-anti-sigma regulatory factor
MNGSELSVVALEYDRGAPGAAVSLVGRAEIADGNWFRLLLEMPAAQGAGPFVIDMSRLTAMDWWAALILLWVGRVITRRGGQLVLSGALPAVARLLDDVGAAAVVTIDRPGRHHPGDKRPVPLPQVSAGGPSSCMSAAAPAPRAGTAARHLTRCPREAGAV